MANAFDRFDVQGGESPAQPAENPFDAFDGQPDIQHSAPVETDDDPGLFSNSLRNAGERGFDLLGNAVQFVGNIVEKGNEKFKDVTGLEVRRPKLPFLPDDYASSRRAIDAGQEIEDQSLGYKPKFTIDKALDEPTLRNLAGAVAEQGPAALSDMAALIISTPAYLASRTQEIGEARVENDGGDIRNASPELQKAIVDNFANGTEIPEDLRLEAEKLAENGGMPELKDYLVAGPTAAASVLLDRFALGKLLPGGGKAATSAKQVPGAVGRAVATEATTEAVQEGGIEYAGESIGTEAGYDPTMAGRRAAGGALVGGPTGGVVRGGTASYEAATAEPEQSTAGRESVGEGARMDAEPGQEGAVAQDQAGASNAFDQFDEPAEASTPESAPEAQPVEPPVLEVPAEQQVTNDDGTPLEDPGADAPVDQVEAMPEQDAAEAERQEVIRRAREQMNQTLQAGDARFDAPVATDDQAQPEVAPVDQDDALSVAAAETDTNPTDAQKDAGNYRKGRIRLQGLDIAIENPKGSTRSGTDPDGKKWESTMAHHYGDIKGTKAADGDNLDVFIGPDPESDRVFVIDQVNADGTFDESKVMMGFRNQKAARDGYRANYEPGWKVGPTTRMSMDEFKEWVKNGDTTKPLQPEKVKRKKPAEATLELSNAKDQGLHGWRQPRGGKGFVYSIKKGGEQIGFLDISVLDDGTARIEDVVGDKGANSIGAREVRRLMRQVMNRHPGITSFAGERVSGIRRGGQHGFAGTGDEVKVNVRSRGEAAEQKPAEAKKKPVSRTERNAKKVKQWLGADQGDTVTFSEDVGYAKAGTEYKITKIDGDGAWVDSGAGQTNISRADVVRAERGGVAVNKVEPQAEQQSETAGTASSQERGAKSGSENQETAQPVQPIEDFGEKIEGARKDYASKLADAKERDVSTVPLSQSWPEPKYQKMLDDGVPAETVALVRALRDEVPTKPQKGWKLKGWTEMVTGLRDLAGTLMESQGAADKVVEQIRAMKASNSTAREAKHILGRMDLYQEFGHEDSFKGITFGESFYQMYMGENNVTIWEVERLSKATAFGNMPRTLATGKTREEALANLRKALDKIPESTKAGKAVRFNIYRDRYSNDVFIGKKIGKDVVRLKTFDDDMKAARKYLEENQQALEAQLEKMKQIPAHRRQSNSPRVGVDHRKGGNVTPEAFADTFGFRGVQFGNYVEQDRRQADLNEAYDSLMDLAGILDIPAKAISLNGELGLAFGARGKGGKNAPTAHYEPGTVVINLTKRTGAGSLAHEWFHSLDNYFGRARGAQSADRFATRGEPDMAARPEVVEAFRNVKQTVNRIRMKERSRSLDKMRTKPYWSTDVEMTARAFESYVIEKLKDQGASNDYLANIVSEDYWKASEAMGMQDSDSYPYPEAAEIPEIRAAYDNLFEVIEAKEGDDGNIMLYSRGGQLPQSPLPTNQVRRTVDEFLRRYRGADDVDVRIHETAETLPGYSADRDTSAAIQGQYDSRNDRLHLVARAFGSRREIRQALQEEILVHKGLGFFSPVDRQQLYSDIQKAAGESSEVRALWEQTVQDYKPVSETYDLNEDQANRLYAEELLGSLAQRNVNWLARGWRRVRQAIKRLLVKAGWVRENIGVDELRERIQLVAQAFERGRRAPRRDFTSDVMGREDESSEVQDSGSDMPSFSRGNNLPPNVKFNGPGIPDLDPQPFGPPSDTLLRKAISKIADKHTVLKGVQQNIQDQFGEIPDPANAYRAEELFHGKVENDIRLIQENMVEPLAKAMSENDVSLKQLDEFLYALHAPERNAVIAERNPEMPEGGSGMTDSEAAAIIAKVEKEGKLKQYQALAKRVHDMLAMRRKILKSAGLEDADTIGAWEESYKNYVPLKGWAADEQQPGMPRAGKGFAIAGKESQMAAGRKSKAASPLANTISDLSEAVLRRRKNEVGQSFMSLVQAYPNDNYWRVYTDENPEVERKAVRVKDPTTGKMKVEVREQTIPMAMMSDRYFTTKVDGKTHYIKIEDQRLMNAMRNIGPDNSNLLIRSLAAVTRVMSSLNTSYNPEFVISNFSRDIQTALLNLTSEQSSEDGKARGKKIAAKTLKDVATSIRAINASLKGKALTGKAGEWQAHFDQFRADGAKTGWFDMKDIDGQMKDLEKMIAVAGGGATNTMRRAFKATTDWVENTNSAIENGVRLSAYVNAIEAGIPRSQAASLAKNMTVNFNRKGELGTMMNALYMFANASVQGTANFVRTLGRLNGVKGDPMWRRMHTAQKIAVGMAVGGFALSMLNRLVAGEDDDEVNWWDKVPDYIKERNIVIMKSLVGGEPGEYWTIPLPYGYNIFPVIGTSMEHMAFSDKSAGDITGNVVLAALGSFSPIGFEESQEAYGVIAKNIMPTILRPVASISLNENFMGGPIYKENFPFGTQKPDSALYFRSTPEVFKGLAEGLNDATGGSEFRSGAVDLSPDVMQFLVGYYGGGAYDFFTSRTPNAVIKAVSGVEMEDREIPFVRKLTGNVLPYEDQSIFYDRRNEIQQLVSERENLKGRERIEFIKDYRNKLRLQGAMKSTEDRLKMLRKQRDRIEAMDLSAAEEDEKLQHVEKQMKRSIDQFNKRYNESED